MNNVTSAKVQESTEFTFHPRVSTASSRIVSNLGMDFYERQQKHMEKQKKVYDQMNLPSGQPGTKRAKFAAIHKENQENMKPRPATGEASSLLSKRLSNTSKRKPIHHVTYMVTDQDMPRTPMPPTSSPPPLPPRSKTYYASASTTKGIARKRSMNDPYANMDRLQNAKLKAEKAIRNKKIFSIHGPYPLIRRALRERGWVEKEFKLPPRPAKPKERGDSSDVDDIDDDDYDDDDQKDSGIGMSPRPADSDEEKDDPDNKYGIMGRMVRNEVPMFQWTTRNSSIDWRFLQKDQLVNHYAKANFTTKVGLCMNLRTLSCFADVNVDTFFPRCYRLSQEEDKFDFIDDFRLVAATAILRVVVDRHGGEEQEGGGGDPEKISIGHKAPGGSTSMVSADVLQLALRACQLYIKEREHDDIDSDSSVCKLPEESWNQLVQNYYKLVHEGATVANSVSYQKQCEQTLEKISEINAQHQTDGIMNTWIVKPGAKSRGRGIVVMNRLDDILKLVQCDPTLMKDGRWVIQKYIERPLLIYGTKFDIRQWFLVTDWNPMTIWMYKACYLRFSSRPFSLKNLDPCIHLCNYSVQKNYEIDAKRHPMLPADNMWSSEDFQNYLKSRGCEALWDNLIYPGMRKAIIHMCQTAQDVVDYRKGSFEMYGADFMIDENYNPWLIEINSSPTMARSTPVTSKMCAMVQEDTLKVVLDRRKDRNCDCGLFELIHKQPTIDVPLYVGKSLQVEGATIKKPGGNGVRRSWGGNNTISTTQIPAPPKRPEATSVSHESKLFRTLSNHHSPYGPQRNQPRAPLKVQVVKTPPKPPPEAPSSPVRLKMQNTMKRLTSEVKTTPSKPNALSLPRFASNTTLNSTAPHHHTVPKVLSHGNLSKNHTQNKAGVGSNHTGGVHCVSTTHAKAASAMGIIQNTHYSGLIAAANRGSLPMRVHQPLHQVIIPKTFPPSLVPGGDVVARGATMSHPLAPSGVMAVTPQTIGLALPLQKFFGGSAETPYGTTPRTRHMEIYNYPGQDFRFAGKQRVSGIYDWLKEKQSESGLSISKCGGVTNPGRDATNADIGATNQECDATNAGCDATNSERDATNSEGAVTKQGCDATNSAGDATSLSQTDATPQCFSLCETIVDGNVIASNVSATKLSHSATVLTRSATIDSVADSTVFASVPSVTNSDGSSVTNATITDANMTLGTLCLDFPESKITVRNSSKFLSSRTSNTNLFAKKYKKVPKAEVFSSKDPIPPIKLQTFFNDRKSKSAGGAEFVKTKKRTKKYRFSSKSAKTQLDTPPKPLPVLRLFSLKHRHEKNSAVPHASFLTINCPSVIGIPELKMP